MGVHVYYALQITLTSPMSIGNGQSENTQNDVLLDGTGKPMIPGSTIAGKMRSLLKSEKLQNELFGTIQDEARESTVYVYDAKIKGEFTINRRDNVRLGEWKTAVPGAKFDYEVVEPGAIFEGLLEIRAGAPSSAQRYLEQILGQLSDGTQGFGGKENRGLGTFSLKVWKKSFDLSDNKQLNSWLDFNPFDDWKKTGEVLKLKNVSEGVLVSIPITQAGGISIRTYTTDIEDVDYRTLRYEGHTNTAVVSGTSWAGAFRHQVAVLSHENAENGETVCELFGYVDQETAETLPSSVVFYETELTGGKTKEITRNAIDRFTAKTKNGALYGEETYFGGSGTFRFKVKSVLSDKAARVLGAALADLINGYMAVGGLTSVGRGLFTAKEIHIGETTVCTTEDGWENQMIQMLAEKMQALGHNEVQEGADAS